MGDREGPSGTRWDQRKGRGHGQVSFLRPTYRRSLKRHHQTSSRAPVAPELDSDRRATNETRATLTRDKLATKEAACTRARCLVSGAADVPRAAGGQELPSVRRPYTKRPSRSAAPSSRGSDPRRRARTLNSSLRVSSQEISVRVPNRPFSAPCHSVSAEAERDAGVSPMDHQGPLRSPPERSPEVPRG